MKPANVLIEGRTAFLTDFGLTKRVEGTQTQLTQAGDVVGTIHYVAPEQIEGGRVDARTDVYSLGCLLYHCLSGEVPFARDTDVAVIYAHLSEPPPRLTSVRPELPGGLDAVIAKALEKAPERRFQTCADLMSAARAVIDAAGPLADTATPRPVPAFGDAFDVPTTIGAPPRPAAGDPPRWRPSAGAVAALGPSRPRAARACCSPASTPPPAPRRASRSATASRSRRRRRARRCSSAVRDGRPDLVILAGTRRGRPPRELVGALRADAVDARRQGPAARRPPADARAARSRPPAPTSGSPRRSPPLQLQVKLRKLLGAEAVAG